MDSLRLIASYIIMCDDFVKQHSDEIRKNALDRSLSGTWNEILVYKIEARDVIWTTSRADWIHAFEVIKERIAKGYELDDSQVAFMKECRRKIHELEKELKSFCTGEVRYTQDTHDAVLWVLEKGGNINREEYNKKLQRMRKDNIYNEDI